MAGKSEKKRRKSTTLHSKIKLCLNLVMKMYRKLKWAEG
jgi:hypothetical protein